MVYYGDGKSAGLYSVDRIYNVISPLEQVGCAELLYAATQEAKGGIKLKHMFCRINVPVPNF